MSAVSSYYQLPSNRPRCPVHAVPHRAGAMRMEEPAYDAYAPSHFNVPQQETRYREPPLHLSGHAARHDHRAGNDDYSQAGDLFRLLPAGEQQRLMDRLAGALKSVPREIQECQVRHFYKADKAYGEGVAQRLELPLAVLQG